MDWLLLARMPHLFDAAIRLLVEVLHQVHDAQRRQVPHRIVRPRAARFGDSARRHAAAAAATTFPVMARGRGVVLAVL